MHNLQRRKIQKYLALITPIAVTTGLWVLAKFELEGGFDSDRWLTYLSQIFGLWALTLFAMSYLLSTRLLVVEKIFGGMDKVYQIHTFIGKLGFILILYHPLFLVIRSFENLEVVETLLFPVGSTAGVLGVLSLYFYTWLVFVSIFRFLPYHIWKLGHNFMGVPFALAGYHALEVFSDVRFYEPLRIWIIIVLVVGITSYIYKGFFYYIIGPKFKYVVDRIEEKNKDIFDIFLKPVRKKMKYEPGEFVYLSFRDNKKIPQEHHPFTISSAPDEDLMRISYKVLGDYTKKLASAKAGDKVDVYGPFGEFSSVIFNSYKKQVWIAGGIGVTPFLSMLQYEIGNNDKKDIWFYYCGETQAENVYASEIQSKMNKAPDNIQFTNYCTDEKGGYITADFVSKQVGSMKNTLILICGPFAMMDSLKKQFIKLGVDSDMIVFENFNLV